MSDDTELAPCGHIYIKIGNTPHSCPYCRQGAPPVMGKWVYSACGHLWQDNLRHSGGADPTPDQPRACAEGCMGDHPYAVGATESGVGLFLVRYYATEVEALSATLRALTERVWDLERFRDRVAERERRAGSSWYELPPVPSEYEVRQTIGLAKGEFERAQEYLERQRKGER